MIKKVLTLIFLVFLCIPPVRAETKPVYLILFEKEVKMDLVQNLIDKKQNQFNFQIKSLIDLKITNEPQAITEYFKAIPNLTYVLFMGDLKPRKETIEFKEYGFKATLETDFLIEDLPIGRWPFNTPVPTVTKEKKNELISSGILPIGRFNQYTGTRDGKKWRIKGDDMRFYGEGLKKCFSDRKLPFLTLYETEGLGPNGGTIEEPEPDYPLDESVKIFNSSDLSIVSSTESFRIPYGSDDKIVSFNYPSYPQRIVWKEDEDGDGYIDNNESLVFPIVPVNQIEKQDRIAFIMAYLDPKDKYIDTVAQNSIITIAPKSSDRITQLTPKVASKSALISNNFSLLYCLLYQFPNLIDSSIGEFVFHCLPSLYVGMPETEAVCLHKYATLALEIYGDPSVSMSDLADLPHAQIVFGPESVDKTLVINMGTKGSFDLVIKNRGQLNLQWNVRETPNFIKTNKIRGTVKPDQETVITLTRKEIESKVAPKTQSGFLILETNDPNSKVVKLKIRVII